MSTDRKLRLARSARQELMQIIQNREIKELDALPKDSLISIIDVQVEQGYQHFRFYISVFNQKQEKEILTILNTSINTLKGEICRRLRMRKAPTISFHMNSLEKSFKIDEIINKINNQ